MNQPKPRIALGGIVHETHMFAEVPTTLDDFRPTLHYGEEILTVLRGTRSTIGGMIEEAEARGWTLLPTAYGTALPSGTVQEAAYQTMLGELLSRLKAALPVDGVLLPLHGAMVTEQQLDPESDILEKVRALVGPDVPLVVVLDMHANVSARMVELADVVIAFDTNPHVDAHPRGLEAAALLDRILRGEARPTRGYAHPPVMLAPQATGTADLPLRAVHERAAQMEAEPGVLCVAVLGGFAYGDTPFTGPSVVVNTDNDPTRAQRYADELIAILMQHHRAALPQFLPPEEGVRRALAYEKGPVILVDSADNIGGGTPGDGTDVLKAMLALGVQEGTVVLADAEAVAACWAAGEGASVTLAVGGKTDRWHGDPVTVTGIVRRLSEGVFTLERRNGHFASFYGNTMKMGRSAWLRVGGVNLILTTIKTPPFDLVQLRGMGVIPEQQRMIAVKSAVAYRAAYLPIAAGVIELDTAGLCTANLARFPYRNVPRPIFPLDL